MTNKKFRVGIFGGSFNPPHIGHIRAARNFCVAANPDLLMVIPSFIAPHKDIDEVGADKRLRMAQLAFGGIYDKIEISDCEIARGGKSYTFYTVTEIAEKYPGCETALFVGSDMLLSFETWYKAQELFGMCRLFVMPRSNDRDKLEVKAEEYRRNFNADISFIEGDFYEISSTRIRQAVREGDSDFLNKNLSADVLDYISTQKLYRKENDNVFSRQNQREN